MGETGSKNLKEARKVTAGVLVSNGIHSLNNPALVAHIRDKKRVDTRTPAVTFLASFKFLDPVSSI